LGTGEYRAFEQPYAKYLALVAQSQLLKRQPGEFAETDRILRLWSAQARGSDHGKM
jgi:hypothetical protein